MTRIDQKNENPSAIYTPPAPGLTPRTKPHEPRLLSILVLLCGSLGGAFQNSGRPTDPERMATLVRQLGDNSYQVRDRAAGQLIGLGLAAEPALRKGLEDPDPEVRRRCEQLLSLAANRDFDRKIDAFLKDSQDKHNLPGWPRFRKKVGAATASRDFYVAMYRAQGALIDLAEKDLRGAAASLASRCKGMKDTFLELDRGFPTLAEVAGLVFVAGSEPWGRDQATQRLVLAALEGMKYRPELIKELRNNPPARSLIAVFLQQPTASAEIDAALGVIQMLDLNECMEYVLHIALAREMPATTRADALVAIARLGTKEHIPPLEPLLEDITPVGTATVRGKKLTAEMRDVALAALLQLSGQLKDDFGFPYLAAVPGLKELPAPNRLGFENSASRNTALAKWKKSTTKDTNNTKKDRN
jgi:HEAT repeat protein